MTTQRLETIAGDNMGVTRTFKFKELVYRRILVYPFELGEKMLAGIGSAIMTRYQYQPLDTHEENRIAGIIDLSDPYKEKLLRLTVKDEKM